MRRAPLAVVPPDTLPGTKCFFSGRSTARAEWVSVIISGESRASRPRARGKPGGPRGLILFPP